MGIAQSDLAHSLERERTMVPDEPTARRLTRKGAGARSASNDHGRVTVDGEGHRQ